MTVDKRAAKREAHRIVDALIYGRLANVFEADDLVDDAADFGRVRDALLELADEHRRKAGAHQ